MRISLDFYLLEGTRNKRKKDPQVALTLSQNSFSLSLFLSLCPINTNSPTNRDSTTISCPPSQTKQNTKQRATTTSPTPTTPTTTTTTTTQQSPQHQSNQKPQKKKKKKNDNPKYLQPRHSTTNPKVRTTPSLLTPTLPHAHAHTPPHTHPPTLDGG